VVSATDPIAVNLGVIDHSHKFFIKVDPLPLTRLSGPHLRPTHYLSENLVTVEIELGTSGSIARNPDHYAIGAVRL
jgi:hypothetical protein